MEDRTLLRPRVADVQLLRQFVRPVSLFLFLIPPGRRSAVNLRYPRGFDRMLRPMNGYTMDRLLLQSKEPVVLIKRGGHRDPTGGSLPGGRPRRVIGVLPLRKFVEERRILPTAGAKIGVVGFPSDRTT